MSALWCTVIASIDEEVASPVAIQIADAEITAKGVSFSCNEKTIGDRELAIQQRVFARPIGD